MNVCFAAEKTLGRLAKWLRIMGFDTLYEQDVPEACFNQKTPDRIRLTRSRQIGSGQAPAQCVFIHSDRYMDQLRELIQALAITPETLQPFSRCIRCNSEIVPLAKAAVWGKVPDYVWETQDGFRTCNGCKRIYWSGSHIEHSLARIKQLFEC